MIDPPTQRIFKRLITPYLSPAAMVHYEDPTRRARHPAHR